MSTGTAFTLITLAVCGILTLVTTGVLGSTLEPALTPDAIIAKMAETYSKCKTYQDSGNAKTVFIDTESNRTVEKPFTTAFVRPDQFRFEYKEKKDSFPKEEMCYIVWRKGDEILTWFYCRPNIVEKQESLSLAIAGATGVSGGSAWTIPALLQPKQIEGLRLSDIKEAKLLEDAKFDNVSCFRIQGKFIFENDSTIVRHPTVLWIDKNTFLVRRIDERSEFIGTNRNFRTEETTIYYPVINCDISGKILEFNPPSETKILKRIQPEMKAEPELPLGAKTNNVSGEKATEQSTVHGQDSFLEKFTVFRKPDAYEISMKIPSPFQKKGVGDVSFESKDGKKRGYISFLLWPRQMRKDELRKMAIVTQDASLFPIKEKFVEVQGDNFYGYSMVSQLGQKDVIYMTQALIFLENAFFVSISIMSDQKDESELLGKLYSSIENSKIKNLKDEKKTNSATAFPHMKERIEQLLATNNNKLFLNCIPDNEIAFWKEMAEKGNPETQFLYGQCYFEGSHLPKDMELAVKWFLKAAEQGQPDAQAWIGSLYLDGTGVKQSHTEAVKWFLKAAEQGQPDAQMRLADCYYNGNGVKQDYSEAVNWFRKVAIQGNTIGQVWLAYCYENGKGVPKDTAEAMKWYQKATDQGDSDAKERLDVLRGQNK